MLKGPKRSFVVLVLVPVVLGVESKANKNPYGTKIGHGNKKCAGTKNVFCGTFWPYVASYRLKWPYIFFSLS